MLGVQSQKNNTWISRVLSVKNFGFVTFYRKPTIIFFISCIMIVANTVQHLDQVSGFRKDNTGISGGLSVKKFVFLTFYGKATIFFCYFLYYDRGQHFATSGLGVRFQKR